MAPYEALYGRPCRSPLGWTEMGESFITGPDLIRDTSKKVSLKVNPKRGLVRFDKRGKLSPRFIGPFEIL